MKVFNGLTEVNVRDCVATMGTFDGLHNGHRVVIERLLKKSKSARKPSMVITFDPHPRFVLQKNIVGLKLLTDRDEKISLLSEMGIDYLLFLPFTYEFSQQSSIEFIENYLIMGLGVSAMVIGYDHRFGKENEAAEDVGILLEERGINVERIPEKDIENIAVSSTKIRKALTDGDVVLASKLLGYNYFFSGTVIHGQKVGRKLGFPTANLMLRNNLKMLPADGVYAVESKFRMKWHKGMMNIGKKPTFGENERSIEIHIFDFDSIIYGEQLNVKLLSRIRSEMTFNNEMELEKQLLQDEVAAKQFFTSI